MGTVLWHHGAGGCSHCQALVGTERLLEVTPSGVAFLPTHRAWGVGGTGSLFHWGFLTLEELEES